MKRRVFTALLLLSAIFPESCVQVFHTRTGKRWLATKPIIIGGSGRTTDTTKFIVEPFRLPDYAQKIGYRNNKKIIETINAKDVSNLMAEKGDYYLAFYLPGCPAAPAKIHKLDSLAGSGMHIMPVALRRRYSSIDAGLAKTRFSKMPYYMLGAEYSGGAVLRQIKFIRDCCDSCYKQYRDEVMFSDFLIISNGKVSVVM